MANSKKSRRTNGLVGIIIVLTIAALTADRWLPESVTSPAETPAGDHQQLAFDEPFRATVLRVLDGDTVVVSGNQKVRFLGVDTLEVRPGKRLQGQAGQLGMSSDRAMKWGKKASNFTERHLAGVQVELRPGYERFDRYGRLLAYVWYKPNEQAEPVCLNRMLLEEGLAMATRKWPHPVREEYIETEEEARRARRGLWAYARY